MKLHEIEQIKKSLKSTFIGKDITNDRDVRIIKFKESHSGRVWNGDFSYFHIGNVNKGPRINTLEGGPSEIFGNFKIAGNDLKSLKGSPRKIRGCYDVSNNKLKNLEGVTPDIGSYFSCSNNKDITSLKDIHKQIKRLDGIFFAYNCNIKSHVLGLLLIPGCTGVYLDNGMVQEILTDYLPNKKGRAAIYECQEELINAGFEEYAQL